MRNPRPDTVRRWRACNGRHRLIAAWSGARGREAAARTLRHSPSASS